MEQALGLAENNYGLTGENPSVGCVLVKNNQIISTGVTGLDGRPHAEANAIKNSLTNVQGSTLYVTLEPCNHYGKTPPCTNLIKNKKIKNVVYVFLSDDELKSLNVKYLKHDYYTDVLSFNDSIGKEIKGDIAISIQRVKENAKL